MKESEETRSNILDSAILSFANQGYQSTSMAKIAKKAGVSKSLIFWYFESKSKLFESLIDRFVDECAISLDRLMGRQNAQEKIEEIMNMYWDFIKQNLDFIRIFMNWFLQAESKEKRKTERLKKIHRKFEEIFEKYLEIGIQEGQFCSSLDIKSTALSIISSLEGILVQLVMLEHDFSVLDDAFFHAFKQNLLRGIVIRE